MAASPDLLDALKDRNEFHILVVGRNGHGKSSLINKLCRKKLANVHHGRPYPQRHGSIETHEIQIGSTQVHFHDTRGFSDPEIPNYIQLLNDIYERKQCFDVVLICHKLYEPVDTNTLQSFTEIKNFLGDDLIAKSIIVCTFGDEYKVHEAYRDRGERDHYANVREEMNNKRHGVQLDMVRSFESKRSADLPVCITSGIEDDLIDCPWLKNWEDKLCALIKAKSTGKLYESQPFVNWCKRRRRVILTGTAGVGAVIGVGVGSVVPVIGTAIGALIGLFSGGSVGGIASVAGERLTQPTKRQKLS